MDRAKLVKILNLTTSANDNEALTAIRMANGILKKDNLTWAQLLDEKPQKPKQEEKKANPFDDGWPKWQGATHGEVSVDEMLSVCLESVEGDAIEFIESLATQWHRKARLTPKQLEALKKFYWNAL